MSEQKNQSDTSRVIKNPLLSAAVTGLTFDDFTHNAVLLPAAIPPPIVKTTVETDSSKGVIVGTGTLSKEDQFSEISLVDGQETSDELLSQTQIGQQGLYSPLQDLDTYHTNSSLIGQDNAKQNQSVASAFNPLTQASQLTASFTQQLPNVASTVFSTFSNILKGQSQDQRVTEPPQTDSYQSQSYQQPDSIGQIAAAVPQYKSTLDDLYDLQQTNNFNPLNQIGQASNNPLQNLPTPTPPPPTFYSPNSAPIGPPSCQQTVDSGNTFRLGGHKLKTYAQIPGLSGTHSSGNNLHSGPNLHSQINKPQVLPQSSNYPPIPTQPFTPFVPEVKTSQQSIVDQGTLPPFIADTKQPFIQSSPCFSEISTIQTKQEVVTSVPYQPPISTNYFAQSQPLHQGPESYTSISSQVPTYQFDNNSNNYQQSTSENKSSKFSLSSFFSAAPNLVDKIQKTVTGQLGTITEPKTNFNYSKTFDNSDSFGIVTDTPFITSTNQQYQQQQPPPVQHQTTFINPNLFKTKPIGSSIVDSRDTVKSESASTPQSNLPVYPTIGQFTQQDNYSVPPPPITFFNPTQLPSTVTQNFDQSVTPTPPSIYASAENKAVPTSTFGHIFTNEEIPRDESLSNLSSTLNSTLRAKYHLGGQSQPYHISSETAGQSNLTGPPLFGAPPPPSSAAPKNAFSGYRLNKGTPHYKNPLINSVNKEPIFVPNQPPSIFLPEDQTRNTVASSFNTQTNNPGNGLNFFNPQPSQTAGLRADQTNLPSQAEIITPPSNPPPAANLFNPLSGNNQSSIFQPIDENTLDLPNITSNPLQQVNEPIVWNPDESEKSVDLIPPPTEVEYKESEVHSEIITPFKENPSVVEPVQYGNNQSATQWFADKRSENNNFTFNNNHKEELLPENTISNEDINKNPIFFQPIQTYPFSAGDNFSAAQQPPVNSGSSSFQTVNPLTYFNPQNNNSLQTSTYNNPVCQEFGTQNFFNNTNLANPSDYFDQQKSDHTSYNNPQNLDFFHYTPNYTVQPITDVNDNQHIEEPIINSEIIQEQPLDINKNFEEFNLTDDLVDNINCGDFIDNEDNDTTKATIRSTSIASLNSFENVNFPEHTDISRRNLAYVDPSLDDLHLDQLLASGDFSADAIMSIMGGAVDSATDKANSRPTSTNNIYRPVYYHWFHKKSLDSKQIWLPFTMNDSLALEDGFRMQQAIEDSELIVQTDGGRFDVNILLRKRTSVYWSSEPSDVRRCSWFYKSVDSRFVPYDEYIAEQLEEEYRIALISGEWHRKILLPNEEHVVLHGPTVIVHFMKPQPSSDSWANTTQTANRPRVVKRGVDEFNIDEGEPEQVDHLLFMVHGIGSACDLKFRKVEEVVDEFRNIALQLCQSHYRSSTDRGEVGRVEVLPISWHSELHSEETGIDEKLKSITLESIPKLRNLTNNTLLDVLFYTSPFYCQSIVDAVGKNLNSLYTRFCQRNPNFNGGVSLGGHSLGSLILFDILCHQNPKENTSNIERDNLEVPEGDNDQFKDDLSTCDVRYQLRRSKSQQINHSIGYAGTGQPYIKYPQLLFHPNKFFAMGSPIGMFVTIRGIDHLGLDFKLPTCDGFYNIFHPYDPVAYRMESLINGELKTLRPVLIPHHKGRKRMHLELRETVARVGSDLKQKLMDTFKNTIGAVYQSKSLNKTEAQNLQSEVDKVLEKQLGHDMDMANNRERTNSTSSVTVSGNASDIDLGETDLPLGKLNEARRIDYVLQEAPLEFFNEYLFALTSHVCYWESEDTTLFVIKEIYSAMGIQTDNQIPQQSMTIERPVSSSASSYSLLQTESPPAGTSSSRKTPSPKQ